MGDMRWIIGIAMEMASMQKDLYCHPVQIKWTFILMFILDGFQYELNGKRIL